MTRKVSIAIIGATGLVGTTLLSILEERKFPIDQLFLLASHRSAGEKRHFNNQEIEVTDLEKFDFSKSQICFFCASNEISAKYAPIAVNAGNTVIDKSSYYRYDPEVPLVVPEVNFESIATYKKQKLIANPNCSTIPLAVALKPIYDEVGLVRVNVATYQSVSGTGKEAIEELLTQTQQILEHKKIEPHVYPRQIAFNILPHIDKFEENGYTREEMKVVWEMQKIFNDDKIAINPTAVRVPVLVGHSAAVHIETRDKITAKHALALLEDTPGLEIVGGDYPYPTPASHAAGNDKIYVGRVREDISHPQGLDLWVVSDNLRKGAALNAVQIAERLLVSD